MKPTLLCAECQIEIRWGDRYCGNCGTPVEYPSDETASAGEAGGPAGTLECGRCGAKSPADARYCSACGAELGGERVAALPKPAAKEARRQRGRERSARLEKKTAPSGPLFSWKTLAGFTGFLVVGVILLEILTGPKPVAVPSGATTQAPGANIQAIGQMAELEQRVAANPDDAELSLQLANFAYDHRFFDKAIVYYRKYLEKNPENTNARVDLGTSYYESGNATEAISEMESALKYDPKHLQAHFNLGVVNLGAGRVDVANEWFRKTIALAPNSEIGKQAKRILEQHSNPQTFKNQ
ncbi:MAG: tetratricopeptide repeat protein [Ignavibacteria bacterium]|nr:tetratricopeptide repeat protein [Ignavibacteria bacterium]